MNSSNAFREEVRGWLEDNCPASMRTPMVADEYPGGGRRAQYKNADNVEGEKDFCEDAADVGRRQCEAAAS